MTTIPVNHCINKDDCVWNNAILNFNKFSEYPQIIYRDGGSVSFRSKDTVFIFKDIFMNELTRLDLMNTIGAYKRDVHGTNKLGAPSACIRNRTSSLHYGLITRYKKMRIDFELEIFIYTTSKDGTIVLAEDEDLDFIRSYISDMCRGVAYAVKDALMEVTAIGDSKQDEWPPKKEPEEKPEKTFWEKVWDVIYGIPIEEQNKLPHPKAPPDPRRYLDEAIKEWHSEVKNVLDLNKIIYETFMGMIYKPTQKRQDLVSRFSNKIMVFCINVEETKFCSTE